MKLSGCGNDNAAGCQNKRNHHAGGEVKNGQSSKGAIPFFGKQGKRQQEGHVDAHRRRRGRNHDIALHAENLTLPEGACLFQGDGVEQRTVLRRRLGDER